MRFIFILSVLLISKTSFALNCSGFFASENKSPSISEIYFNDLKNGNKLDPNFAQRFQLTNKNTKKVRLALQNYPYPQGRVFVEKLVLELKEQILDIKNNPEKFAVYPSTTLNMKLFKNVLALGEKILKKDKLMSHEVLTFIDKSLRILQIVPESAIKKVTHPIYKDKLDADIYARITDEHINRMEILDETLSVRDYPPLMLNSFYLDQKTYSTTEMPPAVLRPEFIWGRPYKAKEFIEAYANGGFLMSIISRKIAIFDTQPGGSYEFVEHDSAHYARFLKPFKKYLRDEFRDRKIKFKDDPEGKEILKLMVDYTETRNQYFKEMISYVDAKLTKEDARIFYEDVHSLLHESNRVIMPKTVMELFENKTLNMNHLSDKTLVEFTKKFLKENP